jgi:hypothetical protein
LVIKATYIATHDFNFHARAMGAITKAANYQFHIHALALQVYTAKNLQLLTKK